MLNSTQLLIKGLAGDAGYTGSMGTMGHPGKPGQAGDTGGTRSFGCQISGCFNGHIIVINCYYLYEL